jgi:hypothetical protein
MGDKKQSTFLKQQNRVTHKVNLMLVRNSTLNKRYERRDHETY